MRTIKINDDDHAIVQVIQQELKVGEEKAATALIEIGLSNMLRYPALTGMERVDALLAKPEWQKIIIRLKKIYSL